jgi:hypothetical protein
MTTKRCAVRIASTAIVVVGIDIYTPRCTTVNLARGGALALFHFAAAYGRVTLVPALAAIQIVSANIDAAGATLYHVRSRTQAVAPLALQRADVSALPAIERIESGLHAAPTAKQQAESAHALAVNAHTTRGTCVHAGTTMLQIGLEIRTPISALRQPCRALDWWRVGQAVLGPILRPIHRRIERVGEISQRVRRATSRPYQENDDRPPPHQRLHPAHG